MKIKKYAFISLIFVVTLGMLIPENVAIPVKGATSSDWNHNTFWHAPWGASGVHKGIDIFGKKGTPVTASVSGVVVFAGLFGNGGKAVAILGPKWRIHYFSHLDSVAVAPGDVVGINSVIGSLGDSGNARGKPPHVHYSILSLLPVPWRFTTETQGWKKMFYLNPHDKLV